MMVTNTFNFPDSPCLVNSPQSISLMCQQVHYIPITITAVVFGFFRHQSTTVAVSASLVSLIQMNWHTFCQNNNSIFTVYCSQLHTLIWFAWTNCPPHMLCKLCLYVQLGTTNLVNIDKYIFFHLQPTVIHCLL